MIVLVNAVDADVAEAVARELHRVDWPGGPPVTFHGRWDDPAPVVRLRRDLAARDRESYAVRIRDDTRAGTSVQDAAARRGDVGFVVEREGRSPAELAVVIRDVLCERIEIVEPDPRWPGQFETERRRLEATLSPLPAVIRHVGSTSVPGLPAKPILDVVAAIPRLSDFGDYLARLVDDGWTFLDYPENVERRFLRRRSPRAVHLHVVESGSGEEAALVGFADALRASPRLAAEYAELKRRLAEEHVGRRAAYGEAKGAFIRRVLAEGSSPG